MRRDRISIADGTIMALSMVVLAVALDTQTTRKLADFRGPTASPAEDLGKALWPPKGVKTKGWIALQPVGLGRREPVSSLVLNVSFEFNSHEILPKHYADLDKLGKVLTQYSQSRVLIEGHTDNSGPDLPNQILSEKRAESVKRYLVQRFPIAPERLSVKGFGATRPRAPNDTLQGRNLNRRIEVVILGKEKGPMNGGT